MLLLRFLPLLGLVFGRPMPRPQQLYAPITAPIIETNGTIPPNTTKEVAANYSLSLNVNKLLLVYGSNVTLSWIGYPPPWTLTVLNASTLVPNISAIMNLEQNTRAMDVLESLQRNEQPEGALLYMGNAFEEESVIWTWDNITAPAGTDIVFIVTNDYTRYDKFQMAFSPIYRVNATSRAYNIIKPNGSGGAASLSPNLGVFAIVSFTIFLGLFGVVLPF